jgi:hypothetical protein
MNSVNTQKNMAKSCFAACAKDTRLLQILTRAVVRPTVGGVVSRFHFSAGCHSICQATSGTAHINHLTRCRIFRGKVRQRQNQKQKQHLDERTQLRQTYE